MGNKDILYYARLKKIEFENFRNIERGSIDLPNSRAEDFINVRPSILGLYGQNGSGKTSVIMALGILKMVLSGESLNNSFLSCIRKGYDKCTLKFVFAMYNKLVDDKRQSILSNDNSTCFEVYYDFDIVKVHEEGEEAIGEEDTSFWSKDTLYIENEVLKFKAITPSGKTVISKQTIIDTRPEASDLKGRAFGNTMKHSIYTGFDKQIAEKFRRLRIRAQERSSSFIFFRDTIKLLFDTFSTVLDILSEANDNNGGFDFTSLGKTVSSVDNEEAFISAYKKWAVENPEGASFAVFTIPIYLIKNLNTYGKNYLHVIDTATTGITNINNQLPLLLWANMPREKVLLNYRIDLNMNMPNYVPEKFYSYIKKSIESVGCVLEKMVPEMRLSIVDLGTSFSVNSNAIVHDFDIVSQRGNTVIPLRYESDGIRRIISILSLLIAAYNDESFTVAIDELDSGIFEYLLGELLTVMSENIKGQLIFTSHNLRPLEVLPSKYLCFTTTNDNKRFISISNRGNSNLRDGYYRSIILNTQKEPVYNPTDRYEIELELYKAGHPEVVE